MCLTYFTYRVLYRIHPSGGFKIAKIKNLNMSKLANYIKETKAPNGYVLSDEVLKVTIDDTSEANIRQAILLGGLNRTVLKLQAIGKKDSRIRDAIPFVI